MRGGLERWKRGVGSQGVRQAIAYALQGSCDAHLTAPTGVDALEDYSQIDHHGVTRFIVQAGAIDTDTLDRDQLRTWVEGCDPLTGERRGRELTSPDADLLLDGTINAPKSFSIAALLHPELASEFEALQDRLRDRIITTWQRELNARRGAGGRYRESIARLEVVELQHRRSRALDPHIHRHLWLNVRVQGVDGKWSNVDSRVAMRLHTLVNAEGELAARTDPEWAAALARHGYTLNGDGEIAELAGVVRTFSRRSNQIETNRARLLAQWRVEHPGQEPGVDVSRQIDRRAWALARPNKPDNLDEDAWEQRVRDELIDLDPAVLHPRRPVAPAGSAVADLDRDLLAARAIVDADQRSTSYGGRFSAFDVRAGATRAVAASGVVASRVVMQELIEDITARAEAMTVHLLDREGETPGHVKGYMAASTAALKVDLAEAVVALATPGRPLARETVARCGAAELSPDVSVDDAQADAAAAIAGTDRVVAVTGPAGSGKTTLLRIANRALRLQKRRMVIVAPTKKAASVAGRAVGTTASSIHAFLADHGWRWGTDDAGQQVWTRLPVGAPDPVTGIPFAGPRLPLGPGDRIIVDEAGMVDLHTANALVALAAETGAGIAMIGDPYQAAPVGHSGALAAVAARATARVELTAVHRFRDPAYAALTLRMRRARTPEARADVARLLIERGHVTRVESETDARQVMVDAWVHSAARQERIALVTATNAEADAINTAIQQHRIDCGDLDPTVFALGRDDQRIYRGETVQTRRNDSRAGVENRALWTVARIAGREVELRSLADSAVTRSVARDFAAEHLQLAYASTVHGIQGETTDTALVGPGVDAAGLYVGLTRGRSSNNALVIAATQGAARSRLLDCLHRGLPEVMLPDAILRAHQDLQRSARNRQHLDADEARSRGLGGPQTTADVDTRWV